MKQLYTKWGEELKKQMQEDTSCVAHTEYPRPSMIRSSYGNLNGWWDYTIKKQIADDGIPGAYDGKIFVPFSPEAELSGVQRQLQPDEVLWYHTKMKLDTVQIKKGKRLLLHFGAVDQTATVYVNGSQVMTHHGGYLPFTVDLTSFAKNAYENDIEDLELFVRVTDVSDTSYHARGKQKLQRGGMYYTAQSGIWQTVWWEYVPEVSVKDVSISTDVDAGKVTFSIELACVAGNTVTHAKKMEESENKENYKKNASLPVRIKIFAASHAQPDICTPQAKIQEVKARAEIMSHEDMVEIQEMSGKSDQTDILYETLVDMTLQVPKDCIELWDVEAPYLYDYEISIGAQEETADVIYGYFAMRSFTTEMDHDGVLRICLNHEPIFMEGVLDQGYWPDGLMTPPADEAYIFDILGMKETGFHMMRKHIKLEAERFYFHCDRLGMIVWQDMVNGGTSYKDWYVTYFATALSFLHIRCRDTHKKLLAREDAVGCAEWKQEMLATIKLLKKHPCISTWVLFNEGWGQFATNEMVALAKEADPTRLIDAASGWYDQGCGDMNSFHNYFFPLVIPRDKKKAGRVAVLSEYGGYSYGMPEHATTEDIYGYGTYKDTKSLREAYQKRRREAMALIADGLCASVYTQVSDIEDEVNGIYTYDRKIKKI